MGEGGKSIYFEKKPSICYRVRSRMPRNRKVGIAVLEVKLIIDKVQEGRRAELLVQWRGDWGGGFLFPAQVIRSFSVSRLRD